MNESDMGHFQNILGVRVSGGKLFVSYEANQHHGSMIEPSHPCIQAIVAIGSAIREKGHRRSDFDLLILHHGKRPTLEAPLEVDIRFLEIERANEKMEEGDEVVCWALKLGLPIYDPKGAWEHLQQAWEDRIPLPSAAEATKRAKRALERAKEMLHAGDDSAADDFLLAAITQFVRQRLIHNHVFPASRPELADQLRSTAGPSALADILDQVMYGNPEPRSIIQKLRRILT